MARGVRVSGGIRSNRPRAPQQRAYLFQALSLSHSMFHPHASLLSQRHQSTHQNPIRRYFTPKPAPPRSRSRPTWCDDPRSILKSVLAPQLDDAALVGLCRAEIVDLHGMRGNFSVSFEICSARMNGWCLTAGGYF